MLKINSRAAFKEKQQASWTLSHLFKDLGNINFSRLKKGEVLDIP